MGLTMSEKVQAARDRALLISQQDADAPRLTDRLDAQSLAVLVEAFDATRAKLAECEQKAESYDLTHTGDWFERARALGQRDPAKYAGRDIWHVAVEMAESLAEVERERDEAAADAREAAAHIGRLMLSKAASQAECARLREYANHKFMECDGAKLWWFTKHNAGPYGPSDEFPCTCGFSLASAPGSTDALREVCERVVRRLWVERDAHEHAYKRQGVMFDASAFVSRILGERSDDAPQGRGEREKEGGDE